jgi:hypothetical protein
MKKFEWILIGIFVVALVYFKFVAKPNVTKVEEQESPTTVPTQSVETNDSNLKTYHSSKFGLSFKYDQKSKDTADYFYGVEEKDNKIYVYYELKNQKGELEKKIEDGQYVEVFTKDPEESLSEAITKKFLKGYSTKDCFVKTDGKSELPNNFETATISFPIVENSPDDSPWWANADKCPKVYTSTNGVAYFAMDKNHPNKFLFFNIGQYLISAGDKAWQETIQLD